MSLPEQLDGILSKLIDDITIAGYGKKDFPNKLIERHDKQPFASYDLDKNKSKQSILTLFRDTCEEVINIIEPDVEYELSLYETKKLQLAKLNQLIGKDSL